MTKGARTRERILATAADLFHARGVNATTLGDVLRASGTGKGQMYQHFDGRDDLVRQVLERRRADIEEALARPIETWDDLRAFMLWHLDGQRAFAFERGCPIGTAAYALQADQDAARAELRRIFDHMRERIVRFLRAEREAGRLDAAADPRRLADFTVAAVQGALLLGLLERAEPVVEGAMEEAFRHLRSHAR
jgi:TetR/AcrR family transcriptional regulator, transcriptional repressor for nem operon